MIKLQPLIDKFYKLKIEFRKQLRLGDELTSPLALFKRTALICTTLLGVVFFYGLSLYISQYAVIPAMALALAASAILYIHNDENYVDVLIQSIGATLLASNFLTLIIRSSVENYPGFFDMAIPVVLVVFGLLIMVTGMNMKRTKWTASNKEWTWNE